MVMTSSAPLKSVLVRPRSGSPRSAPLALHESIEALDPAESTDPSEPAEPIENAEAKDPTDPIESAEPTEPIDRNEPLDPTDRNEDSDHSESPFIRLAVRLDRHGAPAIVLTADQLDVLGEADGAPSRWPCDFDRNIDSEDVGRLRECRGAQPHR